MADVPKRIWVQFDRLGALQYDQEPGLEPVPCVRGAFTPYILATPEALAAAPEVQALIRAAKAEGMREAAGIATSGIAVVCSVPSHAERVISAAILAAAEKLERGK